MKGVAARRREPLRSPAGERSGRGVRWSVPAGEGSQTIF
jgi:hypothetical protein